jgi:hypothetical protein
MKHVLFTLSLVAGVTVLASNANADEKSAKSDKNVITLKTHTIYGNPQRPSAVIEINKARMQLGATTPTLSAVAQIHDAAKKDPF